MGTRQATQRPSLGADRSMLLGVCGPLAAALGLDVAVVRLAFIGAAIAAPPLVLAYPAGLALVGMLRGSRLPARLAGVAPGAVAGTVGILLTELGLVLLVRHLGFALPDTPLLAVLALQFALALGWRRIERGERWGWLLRVADGRPVRVAKRQVAGGVIRVAVGLGVVLFALYALTSRQVAPTNVLVSVDVLWPIALMVAGVALVLLPPLLRLGTQFTAERRERIRADERAKLATHLHDSVLQTLTLIQRNADDPAGMAILARRQERELRDWLYGAVSSADSGRLRDRLAALAAEIEDRYRWRVELIVVGDADVDPRGEELLAATREAVVNAARHSGAPLCDVYAECAPGRVEIFVRDRGVGFDPSAIAPDRRGLADSVVARMRRVGGSASVRSTGAGGTEVALALPSAPTNGARP